MCKTKILVILLTLSLCFSLAACKSNDSNGGSVTDSVGNLVDSSFSESQPATSSLDDDTSKIEDSDKLDSSEDSEVSADFSAPGITQTESQEMPSDKQEEMVPPTIGDDGEVSPTGNEESLPNEDSVDESDEGDIVLYKPEGTEKALTSEQLLILASAQNYLNSMHLSKDKLIEQLTVVDGVKNRDAVLISSHESLDYMTAAIECAKDYLGHTAFSESGMVEQLGYEQFSPAEIAHAISSLDVDWNIQCLNKVNELLEESEGISQEEIIEELQWSIFTDANIAYAQENWTVDFIEEATVRAMAYVNDHKSSGVVHYDDIYDYLLGFGFEDQDAFYGAQVAAMSQGGV